MSETLKKEKEFLFAFYKKINMKKNEANFFLTSK